LLYYGWLYNIKKIVLMMLFNTYMNFYITVIKEHTLEHWRSNINGTHVNDIYALKSMDGKYYADGWMRRTDQSQFPIITGMNRCTHITQNNGISIIYRLFFVVTLCTLDWIFTNYCQKLLILSVQFLSTSCNKHLSNFPQLYYSIISQHHIILITQVSYTYF